jgi:hypothetical protein
MSERDTRPMTLIFPAVAAAPATRPYTGRHRVQVRVKSSSEDMTPLEKGIMLVTGTCLIFGLLYIIGWGALSGGF